jgi:hypothetical protein
MHKNGKYLVVSKSDYEGNLGLLTASLKSSKKSYITFSDPSIVHRAVIKSVLIPEVELEHLDKAVKPLYWNIVQDLKAKKGCEEITLSKVNTDTSSEYGNIHSFGFSDEDSISEIMSWYDLKENEVKIVTFPNKYCIITKKF